MKKIISTKNAPAAIGPYNQAIEAKGVLYISGQIPLKPTSGQIESANIKEQTEQVFANLSAILDEAGYTLADVVKTTVFISDMSFFSEMNQVYEKYFPHNSPARATIAAKELPQKALVEIEAIAVK